MLLKILPVFLLASHTSQSLAHPRECDSVATVLMCMGKKSVELQVSPDDLTCQASEVAQPKVRDDYTLVPGVGYYKFHTAAKNWNEARKTCIAEGGHLAILNSKAEEQALLGIFKRDSEKITNADRNDLAFLGAHNLFDNADWVTVLGDSLSSTGFEGWNRRTDCWGPQPDNLDGIQHCAALIRDCGMMDDVACYERFGFFCEIDDVCVE